MSKQFEVRINSLVYGGEGMGRLPDGRVVFVPFVIPGELVRLQLTEDKLRHARAELVEVLEASPDRIVPRCRHYMTCGGCHYQHLSYPAQLKAKAGILKEQLERLGGFKQIPDIAIEASPDPWNYRNHVQFHLTRDGRLGYQQRRTNQPFAIQECHLPEPVLNDTWPSIDLEPMPELERISLRLGADEEVMLVLEATEPQPLDFSIEGLPISVVQTGPGGNVVLAGSDTMVMEASGKRFQVSAGSFFQVNTPQAEAMVRLILDALLLNSEMTVLDLYSGVGLFSSFLAPKVKRLVGIELSPEACEDFTLNLDEFENVELYEASVEDVLSGINFHPDVIVMDPPRAGLGENTVQGILAQGAGQLAYLSCDPATLARDGRQLAAGGYILQDIKLVDMFPQTYHIESISFWKKSGQ